MLFLQGLLEAGCKSVRRGRFDLVHVRRPGRSLDSRMKSKALDEFAAVTDDLYQADTSFHWKGRADYFGPLDHVWLVFLGDELCGFTASRMLLEAGERVLYIDNLNLRPIPHPAVGNITVGRMLVYEILKAHFPIIGRRLSVVFRTQNPSVYRLAFLMLGRSMAPRLKGARPRNEPRSRSVLAAMAKRLSPGKEYKPEVSVIKKAYSGYIYGRPLTQSIKSTSGLATFWRKNIDLEAGDALLIAMCPTHQEVRSLVYDYLRVLAKARASEFRRVVGQGRQTEGVGSDRA